MTIDPLEIANLGGFAINRFVATYLVVVVAQISVLSPVQEARIIRVDS